MDSMEIWVSEPDSSDKEYFYAHPAWIEKDLRVRMLPTEVKDDDHQRSCKTDKVEPPDIGHTHDLPSAASFFPFLGLGKQSFQRLARANGSRRRLACATIS